MHSHLKYEKKFREITFHKNKLQKSAILSLFYSTSIYEKNAHCTHKSAENSIKKNFNIQDKTKK